MRTLASAGPRWFRVVCDWTPDYIRSPLSVNEANWLVTWGRADVEKYFSKKVRTTNNEKVDPATQPEQLTNPQTPPTKTIMPQEPPETRDPQSEVRGVGSTSLGGAAEEFDTMD